MLLFAVIEGEQKENVVILLVCTEREQVEECYDTAFAY